MSDEVEYRYGGMYCSECRKTYYYREHRLPGLEYEVHRCPWCSTELKEVLVNSFLDTSEDMLYVLEQLDEEFGDFN